MKTVTNNYNFILTTDPITRNGSDVDLQNSVVILDEAHNVEDVCRDSASFDFSEMEVLQSAASVAQKSVHLLFIYSSGITLTKLNTI